MTKTKGLVSTEEMQQARKLLLEHFPKYPWKESELDFQSRFISRSWLTAGSLVDAIDQKRVLERLDKIESLTNELWKEYHALPLRVRGHKTDDLWRRIMDITYDLTGKTPLVSFVKDEQALYDRLMPRKKGIVALMRERAASFFNMHHNQRENEFSRKVRLVQNANDLWVRYAGKKPPLKPSRGTAYYDFVADLIEVAGKDWGVDKTVEQYRKYLEHRDADG